MKNTTIYPKNSSGLIFDEPDLNFKNKIYLLGKNSIPVFNGGKGSHYVYIHEILTKDACIEIMNGPRIPILNKSLIRTSMKEKFRIRGVSNGLVICMNNINDIFQFNPFFEDKGRLNYINGCTDTLIFSPTVKGMPCLSSLYFPPNTQQIIHTHPSFRIGMVVSGNGFCVEPNKRTPMREGDMIIVHKEKLHSFETVDEPMVLVSFHPDSDFGPDHTSHPMIDKTIIKGKVAIEYPELLTKS